VIQKIDICGIKIDNVSLDEAVRAISAIIQSRKLSYVVTPNVDHIVKLQKDPEFRDIYSNAALVLPDGMPLLWAAKFIGTPLKEKISGSDLLPKLCEVAAEKGYKVFFLGGREVSAAKAAEVLKAKYQKLNVAGTYCPPFGFERDEQENDKIIRMIKAACPDILFVGLGAPKQEKWIYKYKDRYQAPLSIGIGVSFEFMAGMVRRAPIWMQKSGLEWFWRLMMEPARLWKRYLIDDMLFFRLILKQKISRAGHLN